MKIRGAAKTYALATQGILTMLMMLGLGYLIGFLIDKNNIALQAILAVVGMLFGLATFITYLLILIKDDKKNESDKRRED